MEGISLVRLLPCSQGLRARLMSGGGEQGGNGDTATRIGWGSPTGLLQAGKRLRASALLCFTALASISQAQHRAQHCLKED